MTETLLGNLIKVADLDLATSATVLALIYAYVVTARWARVKFYTTVMMYGVAALAGCIALFTGNLTWAFYLADMDPLRSVAHPTVRLIYLLGGATACDALLAIPLGLYLPPRGDLEPPQWAAAFLAISAINVVSCVSVFLWDSHRLL